MRYKFTDKEIEELLNKMVVLVDTREQDNEHVVGWLRKSKKPFKSQKLEYGDLVAIYQQVLLKGKIETYILVMNL